MVVHKKHPLDKTLYAHKFKRASLHHEIAVIINIGDFVCACGPFKCGEYLQLRIFRVSLKELLAKYNEKAIPGLG